MRTNRNLLNANIFSSFKGIVFIVFVSVCLLSSCKKSETEDLDISSLELLPKDTGGIHTPVFYNSNLLEYGYYVYTPSGYARGKLNYPLLVFLHGSGEKGNSMDDNAQLQKVLVNGPPRLIKDKKWQPRYPMIVVSPQCHESGWNADKLHRLIRHLSYTYLVDTTRIYLTGLSMGGFGTFSYLQAYSTKSYVAAAVPICGGGNPSYAAKLVNIPLWAFHGDADKTVLPANSIDVVNAINKLNPAIRARLTIYPGVGHDSWTKTYNGSGIGTENNAYDAFDESIYDWMFRYTR